MFSCIYHLITLYIFHCIYFYILTISQALGKTLGGHNQISKKPLALGKLQVENQDVTEKIVTKVSAVPTKTKLLPRISKPAIKKGDEKIELSKIVVNNKRSLDLEKSEDSSLYISALEDVTESAKKTRRSITQKVNIILVRYYPS